MNNGTYAATTLGDAMSRQSSGSFDGCTRWDTCPDHQQVLDREAARKDAEVFIAARQMTERAGL